MFIGYFDHPLFPRPVRASSYARPSVRWLRVPSVCDPCGPADPYAEKGVSKHSRRRPPGRGLPTHDAREAIGAAKTDRDRVSPPSIPRFRYRYGPLTGHLSESPESQREWGERLRKGRAGEGGEGGVEGGERTSTGQAQPT